MRRLALLALFTAFMMAPPVAAVSGTLGLPLRAPEQTGTGTLFYANDTAFDFSDWSLDGSPGGTATFTYNVGSGDGSLDITYGGSFPQVVDFFTIEDFGFTSDTLEFRLVSTFSGSGDFDSRGAVLEVSNPDFNFGGQDPFSFFDDVAVAGALGPEFSAPIQFSLAEIATPIPLPLSGVMLLTAFGGVLVLRSRSPLSQRRA